LDQQDLKLSKKLISSYKKRLEKEILDRSIKLRMPQNKFEEIINNNNELLNLKKILNEDDTLLSMVKNPSISKSNKFNFFNSLSEKIEMSKLAKNFIGVIINKNRINYLMDIINSFEKLMSGLKGEMSATITSAKVLKEEELKHIKDKLKDKFSSEFNINTIVDETLIGGLKIQVGSQMIDSSIKNQLQTLKEKMKEVA